MRITRMMVILLIGALLTVVACAPAPTTPAPTPTPTQPAPTTPAPTTPTPTQPAPTTPAPTTPTPTQPAPTTPAPTTPTPGTGPAAFTLSNLTLPSGMLKPDDKLTISVTVTNTGGQSGTYTVVLKVQNNQTRTEDVQTQDVTLAGGASQKATFSWTAGPAASYTVTIDKLTETLVVVKDGSSGGMGRGPDGAG